MMPDLPRSKVAELIDEWIYSQRDREILKDRLLNGMTYEVLAEKHNLSVRQIKNIVYKSQNKLFKHCE